jgi:DNA-binding XRE family transcriptional regulator
MKKIEKEEKKMNYIENKRKELGKTQCELANEIGVAQSTYSVLSKHNYKYMCINTFEKMVKALYNKDVEVVVLVQRELLGKETRCENGCCELIDIVESAVVEGKIEENQIETLQEEIKKLESTIETLKDYYNNAIAEKNTTIEKLKTLINKTIDELA